MLNILTKLYAVMHAVLLSLLRTPLQQKNPLQLGSLVLNKAATFNVQSDLHQA